MAEAPTPGAAGAAVPLQADAFVGHTQVLAGAVPDR